MDEEMIMACEKDGTPIGTATREEIHTKGLWHETFHCWIVEIEDGTPYIHLQLRSPDKKDFPNLLDISAAGHILAHECVKDGVREIEEELGIDVKFEELTPLGIIKDQLAVQNFLDNERCHVFLYVTEEKLDDAYKFQQEEVAGMFKFDFQDFYNLCTGSLEKIESAGELAAAKTPSQRSITLGDLVPHGQSYLEQTVKGIRKELG
ncbi:NUDIX hydrolase [Planococcus salinarum]|uniref:NUDIX hydrolase n=1 Tax=Planococcus salinarum TaxID=622695 RepID=UPI000E3CCAE6|nr:NUDIX domain-containing protein [Planococcus salinarum]TAA72193.1 NUDIX domain-containing protein [Planococcus salinarum]